MDSIIGDLQDQVVSLIEQGVTDSSGDQHMNVEMLYNEDELELADYIAENERRIGRIPHAFVFAGSADFQDNDSSGLMTIFQVPVRIFVAVRDQARQNQKVQHRLGSKWCMYVAAALAGEDVRMTGTNTAYIQNLNVEAIANTERSAVWEVRTTLQINIDTELILQELDSE